MSTSSTQITPLPGASHQLNDEEVQSVLLSEENYHYKEYMDYLKQYIMEEKYDENTKISTPRFDYTSFVAKNMLFIVYDNETLLNQFKTRKIPTTAFTDFQNVWIHVGFLKKLLAADQKENKEGVLFVMLHEIRHNALQHNQRLQEFPHKLANWAGDMMMNIDLQESYKNEAPHNSVLTCGVGFTKKEIDTYKGMSDYDIASRKLQELMDKLKNQQKQSGGDKGDKGDPGDESDPGKNGEPGDGDGEPSNSGPSLEDLLDDLTPTGEGAGEHLNDDMKDLVDALNESGLGDYVDKLELPKNEQEAKERTEKINGKLIKTIMDADQHYRENKLNPPGGHFNDYMREVIKKLKMPKASWKMTLTKNVMGTGRSFTYTNNVPHDIYHVDMRPLGATNRIYTGSRMPSKKTGLAMVGIDSSMSVNNAGLGLALGAVFELVSGSRGRTDQPAILVAWMDTTMRGEPFVVTEDNWRRVMKEYESGKRGADGRGGTDLVNDMRTFMESDTVKTAVKKYGKVKTLTVITDLGDRAPQIEDFPNGLPPNVTYLALPGYYNDRFANDVKDYARVIDMGLPNLEIDLNKVSNAPEKTLKM